MEVSGHRAARHVCRGAAGQPPRLLTKQRPPNPQPAAPQRHPSGTPAQCQSLFPPIRRVIPIERAPGRAPGRAPQPFGSPAGARPLRVLCKYSACAGRAQRRAKRRGNYGECRRAASVGGPVGAPSVVSCLRVGGIGPRCALGHATGSTPVCLIREAPAQQR